MYIFHSLAETIRRGVILLSKKKRNQGSDADRALKGNPMKSVKADPNGSYTGICENPNEKPVQDADDL